ncbi:MAG: MBL fold metallo-hydrolase [Pseudomonadota bacterium]|nr:MBL fold metallo-hydrolase [Pseudomonadota bacterium]
MTETSQLRFPYDEMPEFGAIVEIAEGILWTRLPLPYRLDHVNIYFIRDGEGWAIIDTGIRTDEAIATLEAVLAGPLEGAPITRVIATHAHPDHVGLAGWLCEKFDAPLLTSFSTYMGVRVVSQGRSDADTRYSFSFYRSHGMSEELASLVAIRGNEYLKHVYPMPLQFLRLLMADVLEIGGRTFRVMTGDGHAQEQVMLYCEEEKLFFAADQVIERISPNISVFEGDPNGDPLGHFLRSLRLMRQEIPDDVLVLSGHRRPFYGLHARCTELEEHHEERCDLIREACAKGPHSTADLVPILFTRKLDPHQMSFAFTETLAHVNRLVRRGEIESRTDGDRVIHVAAG